jgi:hypothetical protein
MKEMHATMKENKKSLYTRNNNIREVGRLLHSVSIVAFYDLDVNLSEKRKGPNL